MCMVFRARETRLAAFCIKEGGRVGSLEAIVKSDNAGVRFCAAAGV